MLLTLELLESLFVIDRDKGVLYWRESHSHTCEAGSVAGTPRDDGRYSLVIHGKRYQRSRIMWFIYHGYVTEKQIDHKNCRPWEDHKGNLREVTDQENKLNRRKQSNNTSGITGVVLG